MDVADPAPGVCSGGGLQPERTTLAWQRTGVVATVLGGACLLASVHAGRWWLVLAGAFAAGSSAALAVLVSEPRQQHGRVPGPRAPVPAWWRLASTAAVVAVLAAVGAALCLAG